MGCVAEQSIPLGPLGRPPFGPAPFLSPKSSFNPNNGICQVLAHMWLDSETSSGSSSTMSNEEKKLGEFFKHSIETYTTIYGRGFRTGNQAVLKHGPRRTLDHIRTTGAFPIDL
ncbi:hypothetical protein TB2_002410 [Malus domestica]|uniref:Protein DA1-like domain-containing protein n=1 Tax=Malus domestica TaxID=3750 RepID=A0A498IQV9_MALDO|nr:hypothetical protein DVH24_009410 [Malus domestica]